MGDKGNTGATGPQGIGVKSSTVTYQASTSGTILFRLVVGYRLFLPLPQVNIYGRELLSLIPITRLRHLIRLVEWVKMERMVVLVLLVNQELMVKVLNTLLLPIKQEHRKLLLQLVHGLAQYPKRLQPVPYLWTRTVIGYTDNTTSTSYSVSSTLDSVEIGGRNLLLKAKNMTFGSSNILQTVSFKGWDCYAESYLVDVDWNSRYGESITYRCWLDNTDENAFSNTGIMLHFRYADNTYKQFFSNSLSKGQSGWCQITTTIPDPTKLSNPTTIIRVEASIRHNSGEAPLTTVSFKNAKVELGNKATDWSPAPEDVQEDIKDSIDDATSAITEEYKICNRFRQVNK